MQGTFTEIINSSWEWTRAVLFRPFRLKKWLLLCIIALMAAEFSGCNMNFNLPGKKARQEIVEPGEGILPAAGASEQAGKLLWALPFIIAAGAVALAFFLLLLWLYSRFTFIFLRAVARNDVSIKIPFQENRFVGNSFFKWNISVFIAVGGLIMIMVLLLMAGVFLLQDAAIVVKALCAALWGLMLFFIILALILVNIIARDLVLPVMYKEKMGVMGGWRQVLNIVSSDKVGFIKYVLLKALLRIGAGIIAVVISVVVLLMLLIPLGILAGLLFSVSLLMPLAVKVFYYIFLAGLAVLALFILLFIMNIVLLPIPVFFRTFSLKFLARMDERYNLFQLG